MADWKPGHFIKKGMSKIKGEGGGAPELPAATTAPPATTKPQAPEAAVEEFGDGGSLVPDSPSLSEMPMFTGDSDPFFLNIVVVDSSAAVEAQVKEKLGKGFWGKTATSMAKKVVNESKIAAKVSDQLVEKIPIVLKAKGIDIEVWQARPPLCSWLGDVMTLGVTALNR